MSLTLGWYYHVPPCASSFEVDAAVNESLCLLLDAHLEARAKVGIAITGSLLARMEGRHDECLDKLAGAISDGIVEIIATTYYEVCPFHIPPRYLRRHIELDLSIKRRIFGVRPAAFWPGNFAWSPVQGNILPELGISILIVDEVHVREAHQTQLWHWLREDSLRMESSLVDTLMTESISGRRFRLEQSAGEPLSLLVQSGSTRRDLSFGTTGAIHHAWADDHLNAFVARLDIPNASCSTTQTFCGDDGDRINPVSIHQYRRFLHLAGATLESLSSELQTDGAEVLGLLPAHAPGGMDFWQDSVTTAYLQLLDELYHGVNLGTIQFDEVLPLQDVFPIFWKRIARSRWFYDRAWKLARRASA